MEGLAGENKLLVCFVHSDIGASRNTACTHTAGNNGCVRGHTAANGEYTLRSLHTGDILGRGLKTNENDLLASVLPKLCVLCGEYDFTACGSGRCAETLADGSCGFKSLSIELGMKKSVKVSGVDHCDSLFGGSHTLVNEVAGDLESCLSGSLTVSGLKHEEFAVLYGELHVLHVSVMIFKSRANFLELLESLGEFLLHLGDVHRSTYTCNNVLALCVGKEFAEESLCAGSGVAGERNAGSAVVAHITECHGLNVNCGTP